MTNGVGNIVGALVVGATEGAVVVGATLAKAPPTSRAASQSIPCTKKCSHTPANQEAGHALS